ncbi:hypothetical protein KFK09_008678 [Dendrobium nobile]|uniref:RNase H type-1 domain-containing protein n=1 Tax=Dendrobium nobile TaxID=94219 RepID=A0A8T3BQ66_DENNO|nr:hypothetical protein KFK09_008678 [Dendrobium nobile]
MKLADEQCIFFYIYWIKVLEEQLDALAVALPPPFFSSSPSSGHRPLTEGLLASPSMDSISPQSFPPLIPSSSINPVAPPALERLWSNIVATREPSIDSLPVSLIDIAEEIIPFSKDFTDVAASEWKLSLVGYSIGKRLYYEALLSTAKRIWKLKVYLCWKNRNEKVHVKQTSPSSVIAANVLSSAMIHANPILDRWGANLPRESQNVWHPPPLDWIKINVDASLLNSNCAGIGGIFRDYKGRLLLAFGEKRIHWDVAQLEMEAVVSIRKFIQRWMLDSKGVIIEGDNFNIIKFIQNSLKKAKWQSNTLIDEDLLFMADFNKVIVHHVHRYYIR